MEELSRLAETAGARVLASIIQERSERNPRLHFGKGKVGEVCALARALGAGLLVSDDSLTPVQERNLTRALGLRVIDRTALSSTSSRSAPARARASSRSSWRS